MINIYANAEIFLEAHDKDIKLQFEIMVLSLFVHERFHWTDHDSYTVRSHQHTTDQILNMYHCKQNMMLVNNSITIQSAKINRLSDCSCSWRQIEIR